MRTYLVTNYKELEMLYKKQRAAQKRKNRKNIIKRIEKNLIKMRQNTLKQKCIGLSLFFTACLALFVIEGGLGYSFWAFPLGIYLMLKKNEIL